MKQAGIAFLWLYRKEALSLTYLFFVGMAFGAIWIFYDGNAKPSAFADISLAFEEDHENIAVEIIENATALPPEPPSQAETAKTNSPLSFEENLPEENEDAWKANAVNMAGYVDNMPQISIVIDDLGIVKTKTLEIINLKAPLTLSFLPYATNLKNVTELARRRGHELMIHLPMEPKGSKDPGPHAMLTHVPDQQNLAYLDFNLSRFEGYVGLNNHMGSAFTEDPAGLNLILDEVKKRGLLVLDSRTSSRSLMAKMAADKNIPTMTRDVFLDNEQDVDYILAQLLKLEKIAHRTGQAIAIGHPYAETIEALSVWLPTLKERNIAVVPLSHIYKRKYADILLARGKP